MMIITINMVGGDVGNKREYYLCGTHRGSITLTEFSLTHLVDPSDRYSVIRVLNCLVAL